MSRILFILPLLCFLNIGCSRPTAHTPPPATVAETPRAASLPPQLWLTDPARDIKFAQQHIALSESPLPAAPLIELKPETMFQEMDGFGCTLNGGSAKHLQSLLAGQRQALLTELFDPTGNNIGLSYLRVSVGASDLDEKVFSYNDLPAGETDLALTRFTLAEDQKYLIPVLKQILAINPAIKIMGSPWSPPVWMKTNRNSVGGRLAPQYSDVYAAYLVKYVQGMAAEGIVIDALTVQNEPLHPGNNPSLYMSAKEQAAFIKRSLGPAFKAAGIKTKIIIYDHNPDHTEYPIEVLNDPEAKPYIDGTAFHLYGGKIDNLKDVYTAHPDKNLYFTEQWIGAPGNLAGDLRWHIREVMIGATRNRCKTVLEWNLAADAQLRPFTPGGCNACLGALTIDGDTVTRNPAYYILAHASKFVRPGSIHIESTRSQSLPNTAFKTPFGEHVILVLNDGKEPASFSIKLGERYINSELSAGAVGTYFLPKP